MRLRSLFLMLICLATSSAAQSNLTLTEGAGKKITLDREAASIFVANPSIADVRVGSNRTIYITALSPGRTSIVATDYEEIAIAEFNIRVTAENTAAAQVLSDDLSMETTGNVTVIRGTTNSVEGAQSVTTAAEMLRSAGQVVVEDAEYGGANQISIRVRFVEASRDDLFDVGLDISALDAVGSTMFRIGTGIFNSTAAQASPTIGVRAVRGDTTLASLLRALESENIVQILAEPTLTTVSGRRATFTSGGELGFPVAQGNGVVTTEFKQYGVKLNFLPILLPNGRISVNVKPEVSFVDPSSSVKANGFSAPGISIRSADTTVEVGSGQTFAIAGLYEQFSTDSATGVPGLSGILGSRNRKRVETELIIFVTTYLTNPIDVAHPRQPNTDIANTVGFITK